MKTDSCALARVTLALVVFLAISAPIRAQSVVGITWDAVSGQPVPGANVRVLGPTGEAVDHPGTVSGADGMFELRLPSHLGPVILVAEKDEKGEPLAANRVVESWGERPTFDFEPSQRLSLRWVGR